jgi:hypothetical protein
MASAVAAPASAPVPAPSSQRWLYGPVPDLLLGCGVAYMAFFALLCLDGARMQAWLPIGLLALVSVACGTPHYGATLLRVYEQRSERRKYVVFTVYATAAIWALYVAGLYQGLLGSLVLTLYLTWSPWHYTGQNYGVALLFLRRRGVAVTPDVKRLIHASFVLSYVLTFLAIHGAAYTADYAPIDYRGSIYHFMPLGLPAPEWVWAFAVLGVAYLGVSGAAARKLLARARPSDLLPTALVAGTQLLWFSLPPLGRELGLLRGLAPFRPDFGAFLFIWVAAGHAIQYLWVTSYYAGKRSRAERWPYYARCVFAGSAIWSLPAIAYVAWHGWAGAGIGGVASGEDAGVLLAAVVNLHHFMLDGAIWKLRDGRVARVLIRREAVPSVAEAIEAPRRRWLAPVLLTAGALWTFSTIGSVLEHQLVFTPALARGDFGAAETALDHLALIRRDGQADYQSFAEAALTAGDPTRAMRVLDQAITRHGWASSFSAKGFLLEVHGDLAGAAATYEAGLRANPGAGKLLYGLGRTELARGEVARAIPILERAHQAVPDDKRIELTLERAREQHPAAPALPAAGPSGG